MLELPVLQAMYPVYAPVAILMLYLTEECNLRCTYCFVKKSPRAMTPEIAKKSVECFLSRDTSGSLAELNLTFFGGEPFLELDLMELVVEETRRRRPGVFKRVQFSATTNGTLAGPRVEKVIRDTQMRLLVSLDGTPEANRERVTISGRPSSSLVERNFGKLLSWSPQLVTRLTFGLDSLNLAQNVRYLLELGAPSVALAPIQEALWTGMEERLAEAYSELAEWLIGEARLGRRLPLEITWEMLRMLHQVRRGGPRPQRACGVGNFLIAIDPSGNIMPCHQFLYRPQDWLGTVDEPRLGPERSAFVGLTSRDILGCDTCSAESVCGGGCRAVALKSGLGLKGAHPGHCLHTRAHAGAVEHIYTTLSAEQNPVFLAALRGSSLPPALAELATRSN